MLSASLRQKMSGNNCLFRSSPSGSPLAIRPFYTVTMKGSCHLYTVETLLGWATPVLWWTAFITVLIFGMLCINIIVRKQWIEHEKLSYPIIQLPLQLTETPRNSLFENKLMWLGFGIAGGLALWNGLNFLYPFYLNSEHAWRSFNLYGEPLERYGENSILTLSVCHWTRFLYPP